jgi:hypothetical protein
MFKKLIKEIHAQIIAIGAAIVVIKTLSGEARTWGIWLTAIPYAIYMLGVLIKRED